MESLKTLAKMGKYSCLNENMKRGQGYYRTFEPNQPGELKPKSIKSLLVYRKQHVQIIHYARPAHIW